MDKDPAEVETWSERDRRWLIVTRAAHGAAAPKVTEKVK
jgi:hypothetical protein